MFSCKAAGQITDGEEVNQYGTLPVSADNRVVETIAPKVYDGAAYVANGSTQMVHAVVSSIYDNVGNVVSVTDAMENTTTNFYDANNRLYETWAPAVNIQSNGVTVSVRPKTRNEYDKGGNIRFTHDANQKTVEMQYDAFGRLTNTVDAITNTISFAYDANGNQTHLTDGEGNTTEFQYDGLNRKTHTVYPLENGTNAVEIAEYDLLGNRIKRIDCNGAVTHYIYDLRNRLDLVKYGTDRSNPDHTRDYTYDDVGNLRFVTESANSKADVSYTYDNLNRVTSETSVGITHNYWYDLNGNRTNAVYGVTGREVNWSYDALNRIVEIEEHDPAVTPQTSRITTYGYDLNSKPVYRKYPSDVEEKRTFDPMGRLLTMTTTNMVNDGWFSMAYEYDLVGSALKMTQESGNLTGTKDATTTWTYDDRYRLKTEAVDVVGGTNSVTSYAWDNADNRLSKTNYVNGAWDSTTTYTNNALNQMTGYGTVGAAPATAVEFAYDANGSRTNMVKTVGGASSTSTAYSYDEDNRLVAVSDGGSGSTPTHTFAYDYRSRRYYRSTPTTPHMYCVFDGGLSIQEHEVPSADLTLNPLTLNTVQTEFVRGEGMGGGVGGMVYSIKHPAPDAQSQTPTIIYSHANHRGDVIARSNQDKGLTSFALYEAYGTRPYEWGSDPDRQKANTKEEESDLGLLNEGMRFRDLETGVFLTRDPIGYGDGPNVYCYVKCNPITRFDPWGLNTYLLIKATRESEFGHAGVAVTNYDKDGNPDGSVTVYELGPDGYTSSVQSEPSLSSSASDDDAKWDGIIKFETGQETDQGVKDALSDHEKNNPDYNSRENNCSDYAKEGVNAVGDEKVDGTETGTVPTKYGPMPVEGTTPNQLFNETEKLPGAQIMADPGSILDRNSIDVYLGTEDGDTGNSGDGENNENNEDEGEGE